MSRYAEIDGASRFARFRDITLTQLAGVLSVVTLLRAVWDFREFDLIFLMTGGGPVMGTTTLPLLVYKEGFELFAMGRALAIAVVMLLCMLVLISLYLWALSRSAGAEPER